MKIFLYKNSKKLAVFALIVFFTFLSASVISAAFSVGNASHSISKTYGPSFNVSGWINISFSNEPTSSLFNDSFRNSVSLENVLNKSLSYKYICIPTDCGKDYVTVGAGKSSIQKNLVENEEVIYGLKIMGSNFNAITGFSIDVSSNASTSELPQLSIDILNDGDMEWIPYLSSGSFGGSRNGCYSSPPTSSGVITLTKYSNMIKLQPSPNLKIGAFVNRISGASGNANFTMEIWEMSTEKTGSCIINNIDFQNGEIDCIPTISGKNFSVTKDGNFLISIWARQGSEGKYTINYKTNESCRGSNVENFQIFARSGAYALLKTYRINNSEIEKSTGIFSNIENKITNHIINRYNRNCGTDGCIIPIKFSSKSSQTIIISNIQVFYERGLITELIDQVYQLNESSPKVSSGFQKLYLDKAGFVVPEDLGKYTFSLEFNNEEILSEDIEVKNVPIINSLSPLSTASAYPTEFTLNVAAPSNVGIVSYRWNFGDNTQLITTTINKSVHTYSAIGTYNVDVSVTDSRGFSSSRTFEVNVSSPKGLINITLDRMNNNIENLMEEIQGLHPFYRTGLNDVLKIQNMTNEIGNLTIRYNNPANNESDYNSILTTLLRIKVPESVFKTEHAPSFLFLADKDSVDMDIVESAGGGNYSLSREDDYKNAVISWQRDNVDLFLNYNEFSGEYDSGTEPIIKTFEIKASLKNSTINYNYYLFVPELENMGFDRNVNRSSGFVYVNLKDNPRFSFYTTEDINFSNVPLFVSPPISRLSLTETEPLPPEKSKTFIFVLVMIFLLVVAGIVYMILQKWYKRRYENFLFKNRNDLYNLAIYVHNAKKRGLSNSDIKEHLKKAKWDSEQIRYVMRKYEGKNTGMFEFPATKWAEKIKKDEHRSHGHESGHNVRRF